MRLPNVVLAFFLLGVLGGAQAQTPISLDMDVQVMGFDRSTPFIVVEPGKPGSVVVGNDQEGVSIEILADRTLLGDIKVSGVISAWSGDSVEDLGEFEGILKPGLPREFVIGDPDSPDVVARVTADDYQPADDAQEKTGG